ncbi:L-aspartate oxidase [Saccharibacillus alkalitolerans]|uniref:L-aspartate oxidase n=1 Tax=Saccharibacillus alkalitolerans TaxID=2705290 RepID=A0ABX0F999_9BACL|nr:L-aspartate oxidase [Saccharibacillus alkalitolerans]NGZ76500.1 L-aspartate oxidase [Saccharibacillus alkalitolerans]
MSKPSVLIIGAGAAALSLIASLPGGCRGRLLTKASVRSGNSMYAQGGIAAVRLPEDSVDSHVRDTLTAGDGHNDPALVQDLLAEGSALVNRLARDGFPFDRDARNRIRLGLEGAHSFHRIFHAGGDATGRVLMEYLLDRTSGRASILEHTTVLKLIVEEGRCAGALALHEGRLTEFRADAVVIASGGCGSLYARYTGDSGITGDGLMLAYEAGAELCDLEFMQFHPTVLVKNGTTYGLISEAVRGEGGVLRDEEGRAVMEGRHPLGDLAPRDVVARAIHAEMQNGRDIHLDISGCERFGERFPTITGILERAGIDIEAGRIPVAPGMHFMMGGIKVDGSGSTCVPGLYAIGEAACTGLHGANRLASNSLLEALVLGERAARHSFGYAARRHSERTEPKFSRLPPAENLGALEVPLAEPAELQRQMSLHASIVRHDAGLRQLEQWLRNLPTESVPLSDLTREKAELARLWQLARLVVRSALLRTESRGAHYRADYPARLDSEWSGRTVTHTKAAAAPILAKERTTSECSVSL